EEFIRQPIEEAIAHVYLTECEQYWQITRHVKLFLNSLLELFLAE
ncbi:radical SAM family heme chaperone HemW, partial [Salmonella enterica subsp. enterica serovar Infantis]